jgi:hypothetical protein
MRPVRWFVIAALVVIARRADAQSAEAAALFDEGDRAMLRGDLAKACESFEASNRVESRAGTLIRLGECRQLDHQLASAWSAYKDALTRVKDPRKRDSAAAKVAEIEPLLSYLTISVPDDRRIDGLAVTRNGASFDPLLWNHAIPVDGGTYTIAVHAPGHDDWSATVEVPADHGKVSVDVPKLHALAKPVPPPPRPPVAMRAPERHRTTLAIAFASGSAVALAAGIVLGVQSKSRRDDAAGLCPDPMTCDRASDANALASAGHTRALAADIAFAVGGAAAIAAGVVWYTGRPETRSLAIMPTPTGVTAVARW